MNPIKTFFILLSFLAFQVRADNVDGLVSVLKDALETWGDGLDCIFVCNNIAGHYLTMCPEACRRLGH